VNEADIQAILAEKIKAAEDRLAYLRSLLKSAPVVEPVKRGPGRPKKVAE
jgi:hypothetical protein